jgi:antitoxin (DNA-binding transcriptional repressor) of toxin-antitoxin stability system
MRWAFVAIVAIVGFAMRSVNVAELKKRISTYLTYAKNGEVVVICKGNLPVAKLVPFVAGDANEDELNLVAGGAMRLPEKPLDLEQLWKMPRATVRGDAATRAVLDEREKGR